jgi:Ca-activated chloride channel homolog
MSFREPLLLAGLLIVPLALLAYWVAQRRRRRYAIRYPALDVLAGVAGKARGRHLPALLALLSLAALGIALGRPERTIAVEQRQGTVMLVHDTSGSMQATDVQPDRLSAARDASRARCRRSSGSASCRSTRAPSSCPSRRPTARRC